jgi:hypothetical protein
MGLQKSYMTLCKSGQDGTHLTKTKEGSENLVLTSRLYPRLQAIKLLASLTYPLKNTKG